MSDSKRGLLRPYIESEDKKRIVLGCDSLTGEEKTKESVPSCNAVTLHKDNWLGSKWPVKGKGVDSQK